MEYCILEDGVIVNMIVAEADFAAEIGALPAYDGAAISPSTMTACAASCCGSR